MRSKKSTELQYLRQLASKLHEFPQGEVVSGETPDFIVQSPKVRVGIEVTRIYRHLLGAPADLIRREKVEDRIVEKAQARFEGEGGIALQVAVDFDSGEDLFRSSRDALARDLSDTVHQYVPSQNELMAQLKKNWYGPSQIPTFLRSLLILRLPEEAKIGCWNVPRVDVVPEASSNDLQGIIERKAKHYESCRQKCDRVWLLMVAEGSAPSSFIDLPPGTIEHEYRSPFDRVFVLQAFDGQLVSLRLSSETRP